MPSSSGRQGQVSGWLLATLVYSLCAVAAADDGRPESCSYRSLHAHELAVHTHRTFRVDCSSVVFRADPTWFLPSGCSAVEILPPSVIDVTCTTPGLKVFQLAGSNGAASNDTRAHVKIRVTRTNLCHDWFIAQVMDDAVAGDSLNQGARRVVLRTWLYTHPLASLEEQSGSACHPSASSQLLTREFQRLGERPNVKADSDAYLNVAAVSWDEEHSSWIVELNVNAATHRHRVQLDGQHIGVLGCHVRPRAAVMTVSPSSGDAKFSVILASVQGAAHWAAVGCGAAGRSPAAIIHAASAPASTLDAIVGGTLSLSATESLSVAHDRCGAFGVAATLLIQDHAGVTRPEAILLSQTAAEPVRMLTLPHVVRSFALEGPSDPGCEVVLTPRRRWNALKDQSNKLAGLLVVACGHEVLVWSNETWVRVIPWELPEQTPAAPPWNAHVRSLSSCASLHVWNMPTLVVVWMDKPVAVGGSSELPLYTSGDNIEQSSWQQITSLRSFADSHVGMSATNSSATWTIQSAAVMESVPFLIVALNLNISNARSGTTTHVFVFDLSHEVWTASTFVDDADTNTSAHTDSSCTLQIAGTSAGASEIYMWGAELWYSPDGGLHFHRTTLLQTDGTPVSHAQTSTSAPGRGSACIRSVITSEDGQIIARTNEPERDRIYWGYIGFPFLVDIGQVPLVTAPAHGSSIRSSNISSSDVIIHFDLLGQLIARRLSHLSGYTGGKIADDGLLSQARIHFASQPVPRYRDHADTTGLHPCPYGHIVSNLPNVIYLDKGESVNAIISVYGIAHGTCSTDVGSSVLVGAPQLSVSSSDLSGEIVVLSVAQSFSATGLVGTTDIAVSAPASATTGSDFRFAVVSARVSTSSLQCQTDVISTTAVNVGCPPGRTIRVMLDDSNGDGNLNCENLHEPTEDELASAEDWRDPTSPYAENQHSDEKRAANQMVGCAQRLYHGSAPWRPRVLLFDGDTPKQDVTADYIVFERTGRTDYTFNATEAQAGCAISAQSTAALYRGEIYVPCYDSKIDDNTAVAGGFSDDNNPTSERDPDESASQLYEILSAGGVNALQFTTPGGNGRFEFGVRVVDPSFSHCNLETTFIVDVYGAPIDGRTSLAITLTTVGAISCGLVVSFVCFAEPMLCR
eukprot:COSAG02_NODE_49_length_45106_cov_298.436177_11_plen_1142_part_00